MYHKQIILGIMLGLLVFSGCSSNEATPNTPTAPVEVEKTYMEEVVEKYGDTYQHLKWLDEEGKTLNLNGSTYDITDEKEQYGDLWMFAVDILKEDVEQTFEYIVQLELEAYEVYGYSAVPGGVNPASIESGSTTYTGLLDLPREKISTSNDEILTRFNKYYSIFDNQFLPNFPSSFASRETAQGIGNDNKDLISFEDKNWFIRNYMLDFYTRIVSIEKDGGKVEFFFTEDLGD